MPFGVAQQCALGYGIMLHGDENRTGHGPLRTPHIMLTCMLAHFSTARKIRLGKKAQR
jgi:hypothetical protein